MKGDIQSFPFPEDQFEMIVHAAVDYQKSLELFDSILNGTKRILDFAVKAGAKRVLFTSSGAVYGKQPPGLTLVSEDYPGAPDPMLPGSAYGLGKKVAEFYGAESGLRNHFDFLTARCFAFAGPHLALDGGGAIGNFIGDALAGREIVVAGDGTPLRSYLYASDLMIWLWKILFKGIPGRPYNVGSEDAVCISDLAREVKMLVNPSAGIWVKGQKTECALAERYVPSTNRIITELDVNVKVPRLEAITKMAAWYRK